MPHASTSDTHSTKQAASIREAFLPPPSVVGSGSSNNTSNADEERQENNTAHASRTIVPTEYNCVKLVCPQDILLGRGAPIMNHPGNQYFRELIKNNQQRYNSCRRAEKYPLVHSILYAIKAKNGRFLKQMAPGSWYEVSQDIAYEKCCQALRECQKKRNRLKEETRKDGC